MYMTKLDEIKDYLEAYEDLWQEIANCDCCLPCMDLGLDVIDEYDYYRCDFSGDKKVFRLFHTGQSNYFPAICGMTDVNRADSYPVYVIDITNFDDPCERIGNFRKYITILLKDFITNADSEEYMREAKQALKDVRKFSTRIKTKKYTLTTLD
ncbi:putative ORFan [Cotonvirus japonicus]|uniref:ORFan n=1 Tax=Cotonvirus japonicus TaxID=2811091 RepID=A0ABM7NRL5_9VIRU|nr:putative ORFan [Cotonvirus japonicus]BCS82800.1 putative ORFan [Cotonvirus japonicus]